VDEIIADQVLHVLRPAAVAAAVLGAQTQTRQKDQVGAALELELKAARYTAERTGQQYEATDPRNRLVADELERRWNRALERVAELEMRIAREINEPRQPALPSAAELESLARELNRIWDHPDTDVRLKKRILRTLIEEVLADVNSAAGVVQLACGQKTSLDEIGVWAGFCGWGWCDKKWPSAVDA
jgi:hypothetical protein